MSEAHRAEDEHDDFGALADDLPRFVNRRRALGLFGGVSLAGVLAACGADGTTSTLSSTSSPTSSGAPQQGGPPDGGPGGDSNVSVGAGEIPEETAGPFPGDGSNGVNVLTESGIVRSDIRSSFGDARGVADGVPLTVELTLVNVSSDDATGTAVEGAAVYLWHCDREGSYSMYSDAAKDENYLRGVQETGAEGKVTFIDLPARYSGRWPHIHFEVYPSLADATKAQNKQRTSQLAFPEDVCETVYATDGYEQSVTNLSRVSLDTDGIFSDGYSLQLAKLSGSVEAGYTARLRVPV